MNWEKLKLFLRLAAYNIELIRFKVKKQRGHVRWLISIQEALNILFSKNSPALQRKFCSAVQMRE